MTAKSAEAVTDGLVEYLTHQAVDLPHSGGPHPEVAQEPAQLGGRELAEGNLREGKVEVVLARIMPLSAYGLYAIAVTLSAAPVGLAAPYAARVLFAVYAKRVREDRDRRNESEHPAHCERPTRILRLIANVTEPKHHERTSKQRIDELQKNQQH